MGFGKGRITWIRQRNSSASFTVLLNGSPTASFAVLINASPAYLFPASRGLRQGDLISLLFAVLEPEWT